MIHHHTKPLFLRAILSILGIIAASLTALVGLAAPANAADGNIRPPFNYGETWNICQGYGGSVSHTGSSHYGIDLTGAGCDNSAAGRQVIAPISGTLAYAYDAPYGNLCVNIAGNRSYTLTHINSTITGSVTAGQPVGTIAAAGQRNNNGMAHLHFQMWASPNCYSTSNSIPFDSAHGTRICGAPNMVPGTTGGQGTWSGTSFTGATCGSSDDPIGTLDVITRVPGGIRAQGWTLDPNNGTNAITAELYSASGSTNTSLGTTTANVYRSDVASNYSSYGGNHGFDATFAVGQGTQTICAYGLNVGAGQNTQLPGCKSVTISGNPHGSFDTITRVPGGIRVQGWSIDPDSGSSIDVAVYSSSTYLGVGTANGYRSDVASLYPEYGGSHGFDVTVPISAGTHNICVYGLNVGQGGNTQISCKSFNVSVNPFGSLDVATRSGSNVNLAGWSIDPDTADPVTVVFYTAANVYLGGGTAANSRTDVGGANPGYGDNHGYNFTLAVPGGAQTICAYGINVGQGGNTQLGCRSI